MDIIIREARKEDAPIISGFQVMMAAETEDLTLAPEVIEPGVDAVFADPSKGTYWVALSGERVVASLLMTFEWSDWRNSWVWWFQSVYVVPEFRRRGIFRKMYKHIKTIALEKGVAGLRLYVEKENIRAMETYTAMGMTGEHYRLFEWLR